MFDYDMGEEARFAFLSYAQEQESRYCQFLQLQQLQEEEQKQKQKEMRV